jgi:hypothetical protein
MKVLADTNILISALLWPDSKPASALLHAARYHELVLCDLFFNFHQIKSEGNPGGFQASSLDSFGETGIYLS